MPAMARQGTGSGTNLAIPTASQIDSFSQRSGVMLSRNKDNKLIANATTGTSHLVPLAAALALIPMLQKRQKAVKRQGNGQDGKSQ